MTLAQRKQLANILLKEGEEGWRVSIEHVFDSAGWFVIPQSHTVDHRVFHYKAERVERTTTRTPLPIEHYKRGMEVKLQIGLGEVDRLVVGLDHGGIILETAELTDVKRLSKWRWPNETEWHPAYTETVEERVVETLIVEGL